MLRFYTSRGVHTVDFSVKDVAVNSTRMLCEPQWHASQIPTKECLTCDGELGWSTLSFHIQSNRFWNAIFKYFSKQKYAFYYTQRIIVKCSRHHLLRNESITKSLLYNIHMPLPQYCKTVVFTKEAARTSDFASNYGFLFSAPLFLSASCQNQKIDKDVLLSSPSCYNLCSRTHGEGHNPLYSDCSGQGWFVGFHAVIQGEKSRG